MVGLIAVLVLGPKELPKAMRGMAKVTRQARKLASEFQVHINELIREADMQDVRKQIRAMKDEYGDVSRKLNPVAQIAPELKKAKQEI